MPGCSTQFFLDRKSWHTFIQADLPHVPTHTQIKDSLVRCCAAPSLLAAEFGIYWNIGFMLDSFPHNFIHSTFPMSLESPYVHFPDLPISSHTNIILYIIYSYIIYPIHSHNTFPYYQSYGPIILYASPLRGLTWEFQAWTSCLDLFQGSSPGVTWCCFSCNFTSKWVQVAGPSCHELTNKRIGGSLHPEKTLWLLYSLRHC